MPITPDEPEVILLADHVNHLRARVHELERLVDWLLKHKTRKVHYDIMDYSKECPPPPERKGYDLYTIAKEGWDG